MAETYLDSSVVGFNHQDALDARVDTYMRLAPILSLEDTPALTAKNAMNLSYLNAGPSAGVTDSVKIDMGKALISDDPIIKANALKALNSETNKNLAYEANVGNSIITPTSVYTDKFVGKDFGYSALRDNEDFYYKNDYLDDGVLWRNTKNVGKFVGRVVGGAAFKLMEGFGYVGGLVGSIGSSNYWADVADNGFSKWFEDQEQTFKDQLIPVYKKAGFDEQGFFSKMFNPDYASSFWTDSVADGVAFMASAAIPGMALSKLGAVGALGKFGQAFSTASKLGKAASFAGIGSGAEVTTWAFNTAMESAFEGAGVFKEVSKRLKEERDAGLNDLTDEDIRTRAGHMAGNTVLGNVGVLALSNAWENKLFFKKAHPSTARAALTLGEDFGVESAHLNQLADKSVMATIDVTNPLRRFTHYGKKLTEGLVMEGLWEENAQLAIQRINSNDDDEGNSLLKFASQLSSQTMDAFFGDSTAESRETSESIGLGALIGMGAGVGFSKFAGERKAIINNTKNALAQVNKAKQDVMNVNDIYERDADNKVVFDAENKPVIDPVKLKAKEESYKKLFKDVSLANANEYFNSDRVQFETGRALSNYVRSLHNAGVEGISERFSNINPQNATLFGLNPEELNEQSSEYRLMVEDFEAASKSVARMEMGVKPDDVSPATFQIHNADRQALVYTTKADNAILGRLISKKQSTLIEDLNSTRTLSNASLSQFPVEQINSLLHKQKLNQQVINAQTFKDKSEAEQAYYKQRNENLKNEIAKYKEDNEISLKEAARKEDGTYVAILTNADGTHMELPNSPVVDKALKDVAAMQNVQETNTWIGNQLSDPVNGYSNYLAHKNDKLNKALNAAIAKIEAQEQKAAARTDRFKELVPGDFNKVTKLVAKMVFGENQVYTAEELQLQANYAALIETLMPQYEEMVENQRLKNLDNRLNTLRESNYAIKYWIPIQQKAADEAVTELEILFEELKHVGNKKRADQKRIKQAINDIQTKLANFEDWAVRQEDKLAKQNEQIDLLGKEIEEGDFRTLASSLAELKAEKDKNQEEIDKNRNTITSLKELVAMLIKSAIKLFGKAFRKNLNTAYADGIEYISELGSAEEKIAEAQAILPELERVQGELQARFTENRKQIIDILAKTDQIFKDYYLDLTKDVPPPADNDELKIGETLNGLIPPGESDGGVSSDDEDGFDGSTYQRPLATKFFTSTFPYIVYGTPTTDEADLIHRGKAVHYNDLDEANKDYFAFVDFVTNPANTTELKKKLGKGKLKSMVVTRNNVDALGLTKHFNSSPVASKNKAQYFAIEDTGMTHMEVVPIIDEGGYQYYVDSKLNKLGRVQDNKPEGKIVSQSLRTVKYTDNELAQYSVKYTPEQMAQAQVAAVAWRESILASTAKTPIVVFNSTVTRGIPNKQVMQDTLQAKNPVINHLIPEDEVDALSVLVFSDQTKDEVINGEAVELPVGVPFIRTNNGVHEQLHAANNSKLSPQLLANVLGVMDAMLKSHVAVIEDRLVKDTSKEMKEFKEAVDKAGSIFLLDPQIKKQLYLHLTNKNKSKGVKLFNTNYLTYLSGVVHLAGVQKGKEPGPNQMYFKGPYLYFGDSAIDLTDPNFMKDADLLEFLGKQFHNIKYFPASQKGGKLWIEYYMDGTTLKNRDWKSYAHYLLAEKTPEGGKRDVIPVTTSIKTKEQHAALSSTDPYFQYVSRGITILTEATPIIKKEVKTKEAKPAATTADANDIDAQMEARRNARKSGEKTETPADDIDAQMEARRAARKSGQKPEAPSSDDIDAQMEARRAARKAGKTVVNEEVVPAEDVPGTNDIDAQMEAKRAARKAGKKDQAAPSAPATEGAPATDIKPTPNADDIPSFDDMDFGNNDSAFRVAKGGVFVTERDLNTVVADIKRMIPQFPVERLKRIIKTTNGIEAWGQFVNNTIKIYEGAEEGTAYHEVFEAVVNRILTDKEWETMHREFNARPGYFTDRPTGTRIRFKDADAQQAKEELAEEFRTYKLTGKLPGTPQAKSYFKILWDFIKSLFNNRLTIDDIFNKIDAGGFAHASIRGEDRFASNYRFKGLPPEVVQDLYDAATASMFINTFKTPESIADIDEIDKSSETIYEPIRADFIKTQNEVKGYIQVTKDEAVKQKFQASLNFITYALDNWVNFKNEHIEYLKKFRIKFSPVEGQDVTADGTDIHVDELEDNRNRNDYAADTFKVDGKKSASKSIKFLFASLMQLSFNKKGAVNEINGHEAGIFQVMKSSVFMQKLVNYDDYMFKALDNLKDLNDFNRVEKKLREMAGMDLIESIENPVEKANYVATKMTPEQATWTSLYSRLFGSYDVITEEAAHKLRVKFHNYVSKFAPEPYIFIQGGSTSTIITSTNRSYYENIVKKMEQGIYDNSNLVLIKNRGTKMWGPLESFKTKITMDAFNNDTSRNNLIKFLGLSEYLTDDFIKGLKERNELGELNKLLLVIKNKLAETNSPSLTLKSLDISGYATSLFNYLNKHFPVNERSSQLMGINNEMRQTHITPSFISRLFADINAVSNLAELNRLHPQTATYIGQSSALLDQLFDPKTGQRTSKQINMGYMEGIKDMDDNDGTGTAKLEFHDKYYQQFNASLQGLYYSLPADSETEWVFNLGEFVPYRENLLEERGDQIIKEFFLSKFTAEVRTALEFDSNLLQLQGSHKSAKENQIGSSLRFFKDILANNPKLVDDIHKEIRTKELTAEKILKKYQAKIIKATAVYLENEVQTAKATLLENRLLMPSEGLFRMKGLNNEFISKVKGLREEDEDDAGSTTNMTEDQVRSLLEYQKVNSVIANMEQFSLIFGDVAQYKDWEKRAKSLFSPIEQTYYDSDGKFNKWLNENKNKAVFGDETVQLDTNDIFSTEFSDTVNSETVDDFTVVETDTVDDLQDIIAAGSTEEATAIQKRDAAFVKKFIKTYEGIEETDGQSVGTLGFGRQLLIKSGWRWAKEHEDFYQYDTALMRLELEGKGYNYNGNTALKALDEKIVAYYKENPPNAALTPVKTLMPSVNEKGEQTLLKHSVYFMSYQTAKQFELLDVYVDMLNRNKQIKNFKSVQKVGLQADDNGQVTPFYSDPFTKNDVEAAGNTGDKLNFKGLGIQVETQTSGKGQTLGTQPTKLINLNLIEDGVPTDFMVDGATFSERKEAFNALSEEDKIASSDNYNKIYGPNGTFTTLENLKSSNALDKFTALGIKWKYNPSRNDYDYDISKLDKIKQHILDELQRLEVDSNTIDVIQLTEDLNAFVNPAETIPSYTTISNLLWSIADKSITAMKVNGKAMVQVSSAFFNKGSRKGAYKVDNKWVTVNTKAEYDAAVATGHKMTMTSSELKFYRKDITTGETLGMEVYLPEIYLKKVNKARVAKGLDLLSPEAIMDYLNSNPKLLEGIGFRIPTQATSSLDFFVIKGFLPEAFGSAIVVPSAITAKGGSDFDVDKLNTYLNNWKLGKDGMPFYETYKDDTNSNVNERFISYVRGRNKEYRDIAEEMKASSEYANKKGQIDRAYAQVTDANGEANTANDQFKEFYGFGGQTFAKLPLGIKQQFWEKRDQMDSEISFEEAQAEYYNLANAYIKGFEAYDSLQIDTVNPRGVTEKVTVYSDDVLDTLYTLRDNYPEVIEKAGMSKEAFEKLAALVDKARATKAAKNAAYDLEVAKVIAEGSNLLTINEFGEQPMFLQNTKGAIENAYFESMRTVLKAPENFTLLLSPNSIDHIRKNRDTVELAKDPNWVAEDKKELKYTNFLSTEYIAQKRNEFTKGKSDIGIFAVAMTNFANSQVTGIGVSSLGGIKEIDELIFDTFNDGYIELPFEDIKMERVDDEVYIPISKVRDAEGNLTMDKISSYINGAVDVARDPLIIQMGMHTELAGVYTLLERMGLTGKTTALFLYQPAIREYLKEWILLDSKTYFGDSNYKGIGELQKVMIGELRPIEFEYDPNYKFNDDMLISMIRKGEESKKKGISPINWTYAEREAQFYALANFLKLKMYSNHLLESIQASNHDTSSIRSAYILIKKDLQLDRSKSGNTIVKLEAKKSETEQTVAKNGAQVLREETYVGTDVKMLKAFDRLFAGINLFALQKENPKTALLTVAGRIYRQNPFISNDDFVRIMREYEAAMIDSMVNDEVAIAGTLKGKPGEPDTVVYNKLYKLTKTLFKTTSPNSIKKRFDAIKEKYPDYVKKNFFLNNLAITTDSVNGVDLMELIKKPSNSDVATKEKYTHAMLQLATLDENLFPELVDFYSAVIYGGFIQNGIKFSRKSFVHLMPVTANGGATTVLSLTDLTKAGLENIDNRDFTTFDEVVQRSKFHKKGIVPIEPQMTVTFLHPNPKEPGKLWFSGFAKFKSGELKGKPSKSSQTFFGIVNEDNTIGPYIHPIMYGAGAEGVEKKWDNMPNIVGIPAVKPEFLAHNGKGYVLNKRALAMIKKNDFSYMFTQLYKKVGITDKSLARSFTSKASKKTGVRYVSYLYKPIYSSGMRDFGEMRPLTLRDDLSTMGEPSILDLPSFKELHDEEIVNNIQDVKNLLRPVLQPKISLTLGPVSSSRQKPINTRNVPTTNKVDTIQMSPENIVRVATGEKTTTVRSPRQAELINIPKGATLVRKIGGTPYMVTNRGFLTISEAGGAAAMIKSEAVPGADFLKYPETKEWISGRGKMFVYDIAPVPNEVIADDVPPIEPTC